MAFKAVSSLVLLGISLAGIGGMWMIFDQGLISDLRTDYWISSDYLDVMSMEWNAIPLVLFFLGIFLAVVGSISSREVESR